MGNLIKTICYLQCGIIMKLPDDREREAGNYLQQVETEHYWNIEKVIFVTILVSIIFISIFTVVMAITPHIVSYLLTTETVTPEEIMRNIFPRLTKAVKAIKTLVYGPVDKKEVLEETPVVSIEWVEEARPTIVDEMEWR